MDESMFYHVYHVLNVVKEGLPYFTEFKTAEKEIICRFNVASTNTSLKPCFNLCSLRWLKLRRYLVDSFLPNGLWIYKILLGKGILGKLQKPFFQNVNLLKIYFLFLIICLSIYGDQ